MMLRLSGSLKKPTKLSDNTEEPLPTNDSPKPENLLFTQTITAADKTAGRIRIPKLTKRLFPASPGPVTVGWMGQQVSVQWNPRTEGSREKSGVLHLGRSNMATLSMPPEKLRIRRLNGIICIR